MKYGRFLQCAMVAGLAAGVVTKAIPARAQETGDRHPLNISVMPGYLDMEGDFATKDGFIGSVKLGYDLNDWWSFESGLFLAPVLDAQYEWKHNPNWAHVNLLAEQTGKLDASSTTGYGLTLDTLFHPTPWKRIDPYLAVGVQGIGFTDNMKDYNQFAIGLRAGGGAVSYTHLTLPTKRIV